jgi:putative Ca2+/H+ antiporter (TMEM165/GDT1 family)
VIAVDSFLAAGAASFGLVALAEFGDKSQLVCMLLASRYHALPVLLGALAAFAVLNALAVTIGAGLALALPRYFIDSLVAVLFAAFGLLIWREAGNEESVSPDVASRGTGFLVTVSMLVLAELGDKTQLAVAGLASQWPSWAVWLGATVALVGVSALGILVGRALLSRVSVARVQRVSAVMFFLVAVAAGSRAFSNL